MFDFPAAARQLLRQIGGGALSSPTGPHAGALLTAGPAGMFATGARLAPTREVSTPTAGRAFGSRRAFAPSSAGRPSRRPRRLALLRAPRASLPPDPSSSEVAELARAAADAHPSPLSALAKVIAGSAAALVGSVAVDAALDRDGARVAALANATLPDGTVRAYVARPPGFDPTRADAYPAVILVHQFFGLRQREVDLCDALAAEGYVAVAPDTFEGASTGWVPRAVSLVAKAGLARGWGAAPLASTIEWTAGMSPVDPNRVAIVGFCYGGAAAVRAAAARPDAVRACGVFYGKPPSDEETRSLARGRVAVLAVYGTEDSQFSAEDVRNFEDSMAREGVDGDVRRYEGQPHAFVKDADAIRAGGAAGDAWNVLLAFLREKMDR